MILANQPLSQLSRHYPRGSMLAFRLTINGQSICIAGTDSAVSLSAIAHGVRLPEDSRGAFLTLDGTTDPLTTSTWCDRELRPGDKIELEVVDVLASEITQPIRVTEFNPDIIEQQQAAFCQQLTEERESSVA